MFRLTGLLLLLLVGFSASAGKISGTVRDTKDSSAMIGVIVNIANTARSAQTDIDGYYQFADLPDGTYKLEFNYVTYTKQVATVTVAGADVVSNVMMTATGNQLQGTTVRTGRKTNTETSVILEIKKSNVVVSGISAAQISKTMDRNAAEVVRRVPGVTIQDDRFITVRGLADRYNTVWLNDAGAPSSEADKKAFSFDIIPSGAIDRILVFKTPSPELPGDFAGGMVKVYTTSIPDKNTYTINLQTSYRSGSTGTDFNYAKKGGTDWLGYDDGTRALPAAVPATPKVGEQPLSSNTEINAISKSFGNDFGYQTKTAPVDLRFSGSASQVYKVGKAKIGGTLAASYTNTYTNWNIDRIDYDDTNRTNHLNDLVSANRVNVGLLANFAVAVGNSKIEFKNLYSQIGNSSTIYRTSVIDSGLTSQILERSYAFGFDSRATYTTQLSGSHKNTSDTRRYTWTLGYTDFFRNQPNIRRARYVERNGVYQISPANSVDPYNGGGRYYARLSDKTYTFSHSFSQKLKFGTFEPELNIGNYVEYRERNFTQRNFSYVGTSTYIYNNLVKLPIDQIFADENVGAENRFKIEEDTDPANSYSADNRLIASYVSANIPITQKLRAVGGIRYEDNVYRLNSYVNYQSTNPELKTTFLLPSINLTYNFTAKSLLRAAYGKTVNRPEFRENSPLYFYDFERRAGIYGALFPTSYSDTLDVARIDNLDMRYEFYPSNGEVVQIGGFYKKFKNPIQQVYYYASGGPGFTYINGKESYVYGAEVELRKNLAVVDKMLGTGFMKDFTLVSNLALSKSELKVDTGRYRDVISKSTLEGQSGYVVNAGLFYQSDSLGLQGSLLYNVYGPRLYALGTIDDPSVGELAFHTLDLLVSKTLFKNFQLSFGVQNLLDQRVRFVIDANRDSKFNKSDDLPFNSWSPGRYFTLGLRWRI